MNNVYVYRGRLKIWDPKWVLQIKNRIQNATVKAVIKLSEVRCSLKMAFKNKFGNINTFLRNYRETAELNMIAAKQYSNRVLNVKRRTVLRLS